MDIKHLIVLSSPPSLNWHTGKRAISDHAWEKAGGRGALAQHVNLVTLGTGAHGRQEEARKEESAGEENGREAEMITIPCPPS